jgi:hypothetical protein
VVVIHLVQAACSNSGDGNDIDGCWENFKNSSNTFFETDHKHWLCGCGQGYAAYNLSRSRKECANE